MAEKFTFTYTGLSDTSQTQFPAAGPMATAVPVLQSFDLFPTRIWQAHLRPLVPHLEGWIRAVLAMRAASPKPAGRTNRQGWNSEGVAVLDQPEFAPLQLAVRAACQRALSEMGQGEIAFSLQSWVNMHDRGGFNFLHIHEGSLLSGSFYLNVPLGSGHFVFRDPRPGVIHGSVKGSAGLLVLFPWWMEHYVEPHDSDEPRITIAFNALDSAPSARG